MNLNRKHLLLALSAFLAFALFRTFFLSLEARRTLRIASARSLGMRQDLVRLVGALEETIGARIAYEPSIKSDPLKVSRIVQNGQSPARYAQEAREALNQLRLSCTILSPGKSTAIIKYKGESHVVAVGGEVAGKRVLFIDAKTVTLDDNGQTLVLVNRPEPLAESKYGSKVRLNDLEL